MASIYQGKNVVAAIPFVHRPGADKLPEPRVMFLLCEGRVNRNGRGYTRRVSVSLSVDEFKRLASQTQVEIEGLSGSQA